MQQLLLMVHVLVGVGLIILVLLQQGKGAEMGAAFGSGASQTLFGSQGSGSFLLKITGLLAALFFISSLALGYMAAKQVKQDPIQKFLTTVKTPAMQVPPQKAKSTAPSSLPPVSSTETQQDSKAKNM